jgi:uncharacterized protein YcnI
MNASCNDFANNHTGKEVRMRIAKTLGAIAIAAVSSSSVFAHVLLEKREAVPGSGYKGVLSVPHGCGKSATVRLTVKIPEGVINVKPMPKPGWIVETTTGKYAKTYDYMHGLKFSEGVREITWKGGKLEDAFYDEFVFAGTIAGSLTAGTKLYFPVVQECEQGVENWVEIPADGQSAHSLKAPAPMVTLVSAPGAASGARFQAGPIAVENLWLRATPGGAQVAGGYMKVTNTGSSPDRLIGGSLEGTSRVEIHEMKMEGDVMKMRRLERGLELKPGASVELSPGGYHLMGMGLQRQLTAGQVVKGTLQFEKAGTLNVEYQVKPIGGSEHDHH